MDMSTTAHEAFLVGRKLVELGYGIDELVAE